MFEEYYPKSTWFMANSISVCLVDWWRVHLQRPPPSAFTSWTWVLRSFSSKDIFGELFAHIYHKSWHVILIIEKFRFSSKVIFGDLFHIYTTEVGTWFWLLRSSISPPNALFQLFFTNHRSWNAVGSTRLPIWPPHTKLNVCRIIKWNYWTFSLETIKYMCFLIWNLPRQVVPQPPSSQPSSIFPEKRSKMKILIKIKSTKASTHTPPPKKKKKMKKTIKSPQYLGSVWKPSDKSWSRPCWCSPSPSSSSVEVLTFLFSARSFVADDDDDDFM